LGVQWLAAVSLVVAMMLRILPLPSALATFNPDWVLLFLISWALSSPDRIGVTAAWVVGLLTDVLTARTLGQHALAYTVVIYLCQRAQPRLRFYPLLQQSLLVALFLSASRFLVFWTQDGSGPEITDGGYWLPIVSGLLAWPLVQNSLDLLRRRFGAL
jgi:rod shape-determining protein MreD